MSISLKKGQKVDLTKNNASLNKIVVGLGWDPVKKEAGFFGKLMGGSKNAAVDVDASAIMLAGNGKLIKNDDLIYFGNLKHYSGSIEHHGDNLTGDGDGDDEQISVILNKIPAEIGKVVFVVNIYDCQKRNQHFGMIQNAFIRIV
ncbi:MAG: TerD family protein, partial [Sporomusaceae bacterium]|nr:TerD family protein [Sporomusaceae bacterium]